MVTSHANTKLPYQGRVWGINSYIRKHLTKTGENKTVSPFVVHITLLCCHLNIIGNLVAIIYKLKTCIGRRGNTNHTAYSGHWLKGLGTPL